MWQFQWNLEQIGAPAAWEVAKGTSNVVIAVIDTGVDYTHEDLAPNMWANPGESGVDDQGRDRATNGIDDDGNGYVDDVHGIDVADGDSDPMDEGFIAPGVPVPSYHGTACAGIVGAVANNDKGVAGVNWSVQIMAIRALWFDVDRQFDQFAYNSHLVQALDYVIQMKRRGVNIRATCNSYGNATFSQAFLDALEVAGKEGILNVFAAGNNHLNNDEITFYPAGYNSPSVLSVAASTETDDLWALSNYGVSTVHLAAPGLGIPTLQRNNRYTISFTGTSAAAPHVAGAIALLASSDPAATRDEIKAALLGSTDAATPLADQVATHGRLNLAKALQNLARKEQVPPLVVAVEPAGSRTQTDDLKVVFSKPMNPQRVEQAWTISPPEPGKFEWSQDLRECRFVTTSPLLRTRHSVTLGGTAADVNGLTLDGNFDGLSGGPADGFTWTFDFPVSNDNFANAILVAGSSGSVAGTTRNASPELAEPDHAHNPLSATSVWYRWLAPMDGPVRFDTEDAAFDTLLAVYTGSGLNSLTEVVSNDDSRGQLSSVTWTAAAGAAYHIVVSGKSLYRDKYFLDQKSFGEFRLKWNSLTPLLRVQRSGANTIELRWSARLGDASLQSATSLVPPNWQALRNPPRRDEDDWLLPIPMLDESRRFFRLEVRASAPASRDRLPKAQRARP